ncbi:homocysteine S-methyltransferase family protein [Acutalibacter muris]|uniref:Methionine synthase n=1 Tax=Acutalibacter muris TaxID=1796620 RepID=A0A1Z2XQP5_9FIRM|nr:homocysteine S-methyltransferase family protein [Acutalibacter muris]ANU52558.1 homocysteine methyltransferase [Hungateiclostridiaceae bacterium KB18]ASB40775.1 homocysteine methyltransferase [Acutalibacter muris]QQR30056.1 homocysteine S-methyltransferase family protein [Acutalibacter muris]
MNDIMTRLGRKPLFFDGAMGTILQEKGLAAGEAPELWNLLHPKDVLSVHISYLEAGVDIISANTFGANPFKCQENGVEPEEVIAAGVRLAHQAVEQVGHGVVALDIGPSGKLLFPMGDLAFEEAVNAFAQMASAGADAGADCVLIETMNDLYEVKAALLGVKEATSLPVFVTTTFDESGKLLTGGDIKAVAAVLEGLGADAIGMNCGLGPKQMLALIKELRSLTSLPLVVNPNAGLPRERDGHTFFDVGPEEFSSCMKEIVLAGAWVIGGCCGTTPEHLRQTVKLCKGLSCQPLPEVSSTIVTSGCKVVEFGREPIIIGERINPTGKSRFKQALRDNDLPYILGEGIAQQEAGAHLLDVNVGLPEIDEQAMMCKVVTELQSLSPLPLQIDTSDPETMASAMRVYNGKPLVNSVTAKQSSMRAIFPLVKKYGGVVIGLTITENGIPETAQGRVEAARLIVETAKEYGIDKRDIIIDPLTMAVSAGQDAALVTLDALSRIRRELGVYTSLGVSNVSFGLPQRENVTSAFFLMALQAGLNAAIMNPLSHSMMRAYRSFCALSGYDEGCRAYIDAYAKTEPVTTATASSQELPLREAIEKGLKDKAGYVAEKLIKTMTGLEIINREIVPALDTVGQQFEAKTLFLPQLLMSADAAKAAFEVIKFHMDGQASEQSKLTIVIATVKGDVHDIGKNIVKVLLENYGFHVIDLGKDVMPEMVVDAVKRENAGLVGLSALMTTTVANMKETIDLLHRETPTVKIMVGGAVLTQEYADMIGADFYGADAMASVRYAMKLAESL